MDLRVGRDRHGPGRRPAAARSAMRGVFAVGACYLFFSWLSHDDAADFFVVLLPVILIGLAMIGFRLQMQLMDELAQARGTVAKLAVNEERLRLARDMHDLTGQSLSTITLKAELAAKRLARLRASADATRRSATWAKSAGSAARRCTTSGKRSAGTAGPTLAIEAITARNALEAAGIQLDDDPALTLRSGTFDPDAEAVLAWCLREAVTNVVRHAGAKACRIRLIERPDELCLEIADDGHGPALKPVDQETPKGTGLRGMSERLSAVGGRAVRSARPNRAAATRSATWPAPGPATGSRSPPPSRWTAMTADHARTSTGPAAARRGPGDDQGGAGRAARLRGRHRGGRPGRPGRRGARRRPKATPIRTSRCWTSRCPAWTVCAAAAELKRPTPGIKIVILTTFGRPGFLRRAMESGVSAFLVKDSPADKLAQTIRRVLAGERVIDPDLAAAALADGLNPLTPRERDVLDASRRGRDDRGDRRPAVPVRGHRAELPVRLHPEDRGPQPRRGAPHRLRTRLAVAPAELALVTRRRPAADPKMNCVTSAGYLRYPHVHGELLVFVAEDDVWLAPVDRGPRVAADRRCGPGQLPAVLPGRDCGGLGQLAGRRPRGLRRGHRGRRRGPAHLLGRQPYPGDRLDAGRRGAGRHRRRAGRRPVQLGPRHPAARRPAPAAAVRPRQRPGPGGRRHGLADRPDRPRAGLLEALPRRHRGPDLGRHRR